MPPKPYPLIIQRDEEKLNSNNLQLQGSQIQPQPILYQYSITENGNMKPAEEGLLTPSSSPNHASSGDKLKKTSGEKTYWLLPENQRDEINKRRAQLKKDNIPFYKFRRTRASEVEKASPTQDFILDRSVLICNDKAFALYSGKESLVGKTVKSKIKLAQDLDTGEWVALKILDMPKVIKDSSISTVNTIISREAEVLEKAGQLHGYISRLQHEQNNSYKKRYLLTELFGAQGGGTLFDQLYGIRIKGAQQKNEISLENKLKIAISVLEAIQSLHEKNIIHRDIKSLNIIWDTQNSKAHIIDMGISFILNENEKCGLFYPRINLCGTPGYMAPEIKNYRNYKQMLSPYFYERLGHDSQSAKQSLNPYEVKTVAQIDNIHPESDRIKASLENIENWFAFQLYESQFPLILKLVQSRPESKWIKTPKPEALITSHLNAAHEITLALTKGFMAKVGKKLNRIHYSDMNKLGEYFDHLEMVVMELNTVDIFKDAIKSEISPLSSAYKDFNPQSEDYEKMASIHKNMEWVLMCDDPIYSYASDTFAAGHVLAEIFTQTAHTHTPNRPSTDLSEFKDILFPSTTIDEPLKTIYGTISSMVELDPFTRTSIKVAKEQLQNSLNIVIRQENTAPKLSDKPTIDYGQKLFLQNIQQYYQAFIELGKPPEQSTTQRSNDKNTMSFLGFKSSEKKPNLNGQINSELALRVSEALKGNLLDTKLISNNKLLDTTRIINAQYISHLEANPPARQAQSDPIRNTLETLLKTLVQYLEFKKMLDSEHRALFSAHLNSPSSSKLI